MRNRMRREPRPLSRPVIVLDGWHSPGVTAWGLARRLCKLTSHRWPDFSWSTYMWALSLEAAVRHAHRSIARAGLLGREVDLVGISMGGIVARTLISGVLGVGGPQNIRARRVFTISSPHRGARLAEVVRPDRASVQLRRGSELLRRLDEAWPTRTYELIPFALNADWLVGEANTAPPGMTAICADPAGPISRRLSHFSSIYDVRIQVAIAAHLRGEA